MISIVIITLNEELYLPSLLESLARQTYRDYEVIIADSKSEDRTKEVAMRFRQRFKRFRFEQHRERNVSAARNHGATFAKGEYIFFFDADTILRHDFLERSLQSLRARSMDVAAAYIWPRSRHPIDWFYYLLLNFVFAVTQGFYPHAAGSCMVSRPIIHNVLKGFDGTIRLAEDSDYAKRASKKFKFRMMPTSVWVSVRRFQTEGRLFLGFKYVFAFFYRILFGEIRNSAFHYRFAHYKKR